MMSRRILSLLLVTLVLLSSNVLAADALYRFMHNDHNVLALCEVTAIDGNACDVKVADTIKGKGDMGYEWTEMKPETMKLNMEQLREWSVSVEVGDFLLVSAKSKNAKTGSFDICWGAYSVDSLDREILHIIPSEDERNQLEIAAIEHFIHTDGQENEFVFNDVKGTVHYLPDGAGHLETAVLIYPVAVWSSTHG